MIDELASELTDSLAAEKRPKIAVADLLGPISDHTQLGSFITASSLKTGRRLLKD